MIHEPDEYSYMALRLGKTADITLEGRKGFTEKELIKALRWLANDLELNLDPNDDEVENE
jgi:hypothetical protein